MKKIVFSFIVTSMLSFVFLLSTPSCEDVLDALDSSGFLTGWLSTSIASDTSQIEKALLLTNTDIDNLPPSVDLLAHFPPIGNQGAYGTCVAWAVGYNLKTYLQAVDNKYSQSQLSSASKQFSPKYLFWAVPNSEKGGDCNGTGFDPAFEVLLTKGIAPLSEVPYTDLGDCSSSPNSTWNSTAAGYKIQNYRQIDIELNKIKYYLAKGSAVVIGAQLGDEFMRWSSSAVHYSDTYTNPGMQHAYHAMILSGYDDNKGMNGAFRVVNSWGTSWGDNGYVWVDYDFFIDKFCFAAYIATNPIADPDEDDDNEVDPNDLANGKDLVAWELDDLYDDEEYTDYTGPRNRYISYNVFNSGNQTITAEEDWAIIYLY